MITDTAREFFRSIGYEELASELVDHPVKVLDYYHIYQMKTGKKLRWIQEPIGELKRLQQALLPFLDKFPFHSACTARSEFSIADNAEPHHNSSIILKLDIKDFFPNTDIPKILEGINSIPPENNIFSRDIVNPILLLGTVPLGPNRILPIGAPTSPILANIAATPIDYLIEEVANIYHFKYTRYVDDITLSSNRGRDSRLLDEIQDIIYMAGYRLNNKKTQWIESCENKKYEVTGVKLETEKSNIKVPRDVRRLVRARLNNIAAKNEKIDEVTNGYLAYIQAIDIEAYNNLNIYLGKRQAFYEKLREKCPSP